MPVKRRTSKRRANPEAEIARWETAFVTGRDFFGDIPLPRDRSPDTVAAIKAAWLLYGALFMRQWETGDISGWSRKTPWAYEQFGGV